MRLKKVFRRALLATYVASLVCALSTVAQADDWVQYRANYYGYGGDYTEVGRIPISIGIFNLSGGGLGTQNYYLIAVPKTYVLKNNAGSFTVKSTDHVVDHLGAGMKNSPFFYMFAWGNLDAGYMDGLKIGAALDNPQIQKYSNHLFLQVQSQLLCPNETYNSAFHSSSLAGADDPIPGEISAEVDLVYCPEGGFPVYAEAQYYHGVF